MSCAALYGRAGLKDLTGDLEFLDAHGLFPEIYLAGEHLDSLDDAAVEDMVRWGEGGRELTFHAPFIDLSPGGFDPRVLEVTRFRFSQVMELARRVGPKQIVFHPGFDRWRFAWREELWLTNSLRIWGELLESAEKAGTRVCLENVFDTRPDHLGALRDRLGEELGFCLDTGHLLLFSEVTLGDWLDVFGNGLAELHLHDNDRQRDLHLPVGEGEFDFRALCREVAARSLDPVVVLEHHSREETARSLLNFQQLLQGI
ncbi:MAG: sugar phosphate isomerase/epimerase [bacterium]|nr:sugar phosphate isomerase/epimerase [bacterium]MDT8395047.1 sugar phosphate isomerase/epimerase family protein [bacterium]